MAAIKDLPIERMSQKAFDSLGEYSCSYPTGTRIGKTWKRNVNAFVSPPRPPLWLIGEYVPCNEPEKVGIDWRRIEVTPSLEREETT